MDEWMFKYLYEVKQDEGQHVVYGGHVFGESIHDSTWKNLEKLCQCNKQQHS